MKVVRFGVSLEKNLLDILEEYMIKNNIENRSQAIRQLIKNIEVEEKLNTDQIVGGSILLSYNHHKREVIDKITSIQHNHYKLILSSQHIHLNHDTCMEIIALKGKASELKNLASELKAIKGGVYGDLSVTPI